MTANIIIQWGFLICAGLFIAWKINAGIKKSRKEVEEFELGVALLNENEKSHIDTDDAISVKTYNKWIKDQYRKPMWSFWISVLVAAFLVLVFRNYHTWVALSSVAISILIYISADSNKKNLLKEVKCPYCKEELLKGFYRNSPVYRIREGRCISCKKKIDWT